MRISWRVCSNCGLRIPAPRVSYSTGLGCVLGFSLSNKCDTETSQLGAKSWEPLKQWTQILEFLPKFGGKTMSRTKAVAEWQQKQCQTLERFLRFNWIWGFMTLDVGSENKRRLEMTTACRLTKMETAQDGVGSDMNDWGTGSKERSPVYDILAFKGLKARRVAACSWLLKRRSGPQKSANPWNRDGDPSGCKPTG